MPHSNRNRGGTADPRAASDEDLTPQPPLLPHETQRLIEDLVRDRLPILEERPFHRDIRMLDGPGQGQHRADAAAFSRS
jgi:hypothetical protein